MLTTPPLSLHLQKKQFSFFVVVFHLVLLISFFLSFTPFGSGFFLSFRFIRNRFRFWQNNLFVLLQFFSFIIFVCLFVSLHIFVFSSCSLIAIFHRILRSEYNVQMCIGTKSLSFAIKTQYNFHQWQSNVCSLLTLINTHLKTPFSCFTQLRVQLKHFVFKEREFIDF